MSENKLDLPEKSERGVGIGPRASGDNANARAKAHATGTVAGHGKLAVLRSQLSDLIRKRAFVRWGSAICALLAVVLWLLVGAFLCDWSFNLPMSLRAVLLLAWIVGGVWAVRKFAWPLLSLRESAEDVALIVERQNDIDSDLVAALQFEAPNAKNWGSTRLSEAVVDYVAEFSPSLDVFEGFSYQPLPKRALGLCLTLFIVVGGAIAFPAHAAAFWNRFLLGTAHYPTKTQIESISVNGQSVPVFSTDAATRLRIPHGQPLSVEIQCRGEIPATGFANLSGIRNDLSNQIELHPQPGQATTFSGELTHVADSFRVNFQLGDAVSDALEITVVPSPLVDIAWNVTPPRYASQSYKLIEANSGSRQLSVLEGSHAGLQLTCSNKQLKSAWIKFGETTINLIPSSPDLSEKTIWSLPPQSPFESIREPIQYEIQVTDQDGLALESPITGLIRMKNDRLPRIVASSVTRQVLPTAQPKLDYAAGDDFGVARIVASLAITRQDGRVERHEIVVKTVTDAEQPLMIVRGQFAIPLSRYELAKGDEVKVVLDVTDWRGESAGQSASGEPNVFSVTDLNGILAQTGEEDKKTAKQLDEILRRELGVRGEK